MEDLQDGEDFAAYQKRNGNNEDLDELAPDFNEPEQN